MRDKLGRFVKGNIPDSKINFNEEEVIRLYLSGLSILQVSKKLGYTNENMGVGSLIRSKGLSRPSGFQKGHKPLINQFGNRNSQWKGGRQHSAGYIRRMMGGKRILEHHYIWRKNNNWLPVYPGCVIHHRDLNKVNNNIDNLILLPRSYHTHLHKAIIRGDLQ